MIGLQNNYGHVLDNPKLYEIDKASIGYGYLVNTNLVQIARAYSVFGNNGVMVEPRLVIGEDLQNIQVIRKENLPLLLKIILLVRQQKKM